MRTHTDRELRLAAARSSVGVHHQPLQLAGAQLDLANLSHIDLRGADLSGARLRGAMLWGALLGGAHLEDTDLSCANLTWASLSGCRWRRTLLLEADLDEASLDVNHDAVTTGADLLTVLYSLTGQLVIPRLAVTGASRRTRDTELMDRHLRWTPDAARARGTARTRPKLEQLRAAQSRVLRDDDLRDLLAWSAATGKPLNLRGCNLSGTFLRGANLRGADLAFTDFIGADLKGADLTGADLHESYAWREALQR